MFVAGEIWIAQIGSGGAMFHLLYVLVSSIFHTRLHRFHHAACYSFLDNFIVIFFGSEAQLEARGGSSGHGWLPGVKSQ